MAYLRRQLQQMIAVEGQALEMFVIADRDYHPLPEELRASLPMDHLHWHIWQRTEIENYLLSFPALTRLLRRRDSPEQQVLEESPLADEFARLIESTRDHAYDQLAKAFQEHGRKLGKNWDASMHSKLARQYLKDHWEADKLALADAKEVVLPGLKRWLQERGFRQVSDQSLADSLAPDELPQEVHDLAKNFAKFAGVRVGPS
jgi:hypothetical protein